MKLPKTLLSSCLGLILLAGFSLTEVNAETNAEPIISPMSCTEVGTYTTSYKSKTTSQKQTSHILPQT